MRVVIADTFHLRKHMTYNLENGMKRSMLPVPTVVAFLIFIFAVDAHALLIERDLYSEGDGLITYDNESGIEWLDLSVTQDLYYPYVVLRDQGGWLSSGWRIANEQDVDVFLGNNSDLVEEQDSGWIPSAQENTMVSLMELLGIQYQSDIVGASFSWRNYVVFDDGTDNGWVGRATITTIFELGADGLVAGSHSYWSSTIDGVHSTHSSGGMFLIRDAAPVPEPSTLLLMAGGLLGFISHRKWCQR